MGCPILTSRHVCAWSIPCSKLFSGVAGGHWYATLWYPIDENTGICKLEPSFTWLTNDIILKGSSKWISNMASVVRNEDNDESLDHEEDTGEGKDQYLSN